VLEDGLILAVRRLGEGGSQRFKEFQTEVEAIGKLRHPNIVALRAFYWSVDEKLLIYDYIPNGNLATALHGNFYQPLMIENIYIFFFFKKKKKKISCLYGSYSTSFDLLLGDSIIVLLFLN